MTTQELLKLASEANPELMEKTAYHLRLLEVLAPEFMEDFTEDANAIFGRVEEKTKEAGVPWDKVRRFGAQVGTAAAAAVGTGLAVSAATDLYNAARRHLTSGRNFKRMTTANPELKEQDQAHLRRSFRTVQKYAPDIAADPMAAGSLVFKMVNAPIGDHDKLLRDTITLQKDHMQSRYDPFRSSPKIDLRPKAEDK